MAGTELVARRQLGKTGLLVTPIGLGAWQFSGGRGGALGSWSSMPSQQMDAVVAAAIEGGMNWVDTAELYGSGRSEKAITHAMQALGLGKEDVLLATKWNPLFRTAQSIRETIDRRIECLAPYPVTLHQVHFPASFSSIEDEMAAMADLIDAGKIRAVGVSNYSASQMRRAHEALQTRGYVLASNQVKYSVLDRRIEKNGILETAKELGITIIAYSPLEMGILTGKFHRSPRLLDERPILRRIRLRRILEKSRSLVNLLSAIGARYGASPSQVALNWLIHAHGDVVVTIPGATKPRHATESAGAMNFGLSPDEIAEIDKASSLG